jgi:tRNA A-37 threonylcarbamoyl transferase component Bud32
MFSHFLRKIGAVAGWAVRPADTVAAGGLVWRVEPAAEAVFGPAGPDLTAWQAAGLCEVVKRNLQRTITRVRLPGGTVYVKHCRVNTPRSWAREVLRPAKARLEFENALALRALGIATVEPLAWGAASHLLPGESYLVTREQPGAEPFLDFLEMTLPGLPPDVHWAVRRQVARCFAAFLAKLHDAGVAHPDPHPGNFLVELPPSRVPRFVLTDLHAVRFGKPLSWPATRDNLILLNRYFQLRGGRADRLRFWQAYLRARSTLPADAPATDWAKELEQATEASNHRFWTARLGRYTENNRDSHKVHSSGVSGFAVRDLPDEVVRGWLADPDGVFAQPGVKLLKDSRSSTVAEVVVPTPVGPRAVVFKRFRLKGWVGAAKNVLRPSQALRSWVVGNNVRDRGLPTARPLAVFHRRRLGVPLAGYAVFEKVPDALGLPEAVAAHPHAVRVWAEKLGRLVRRMHDRQASHRDLKAPNVLMAGAAVDPGSAEPVLIDLVGVEVGRPVPDAVRVRDLARLNASFLGSPHVTRTDRLRALRAYLGRGEWKSWWRRVDGATRAKATRNARTGRPLA